MNVITISAEVNKTREVFFRTLFGSSTGYVCVATNNKGGFHEQFYKYPDELPRLLEFVNRSYVGSDVYFCPQLLRIQKRTKATVATCTNVWADLDECDPALVIPEPSVVIESSPGRWQAFWILNEPSEPLEVEDAAHRLAYKYQTLGADLSGWDLTQLLRIPLTYNVKRTSNMDTPIVSLQKLTGPTYPLDIFKELPEVPGYEWIDEPFPEEEIRNLEPDKILEKYRDRLDPHVHVLYSVEPREDWSKALWNLEMLLLEAGLTKAEAFCVTYNAACNKFQRDKRPPQYLWRDICRAASRIAPKQETKPAPELLTTFERNRIQNLPKTFVDRYIAWARSRGDAAWQYHEAGAFAILSALLSGVVKLPTSFGTIVPNLWFMILADTTLTRKSTAMDMAMELLLEVEQDAILATDGSLEGLLQSLSTRPNRPGVFWRDEFSGLLEMIKKKDYYAGMIETLTKLYDGKYQKRVLRKEVIELRDPILIVFCGGIRSRIVSLIDMEHIFSGFLPRFLFFEAESDISQYQPIGPMTTMQDDTRTKLIAEMNALKAQYNAEITVHIGDQVVSTPSIWEASLTPDAWDRYNKFEKEMVQYGLESTSPDMFMPVMDRLSKSGLKLAILIAAVRHKGSTPIVVDIDDILCAIGYIERWREFSIDVVVNAGKTANEKQIEAVLRTIRRHDGLTRGKLMQWHHLMARDTDILLQTLDQRGMIRRVRDGRSERIYAAS